MSGPLREGRSTGPAELNYVDSPDGPVCPCVADHNPNPMRPERHHVWPLGMGGDDDPANLLYLCPTTHENVHLLILLWKRHGGEPPWSERRRFGQFAQDLARRAVLSEAAGYLVE